MCLRPLITDPEERLILERAATDLTRSGEPETARILLDRLSAVDLSPWLVEPQKRPVERSEWERDPLALIVLAVTVGGFVLVLLVSAFLPH